MTTSTTDHRDAAASNAAIERFTDLQDRLLAYYGVAARSRFVTLANPQMRAHVLEAGAGEPAIVLHGGDGEAVNWAPLLGPLQSHLHVFAVDRPGFGLSDAFDYRTVHLREHAAEFVASVLDALGLESATLIGGSMGGFFALSAALALPKRIKRVVLAGYPAGATREVSEQMRILCSTPGLPEQFMAGRDTMEAQREQYREMFHVDPDSIPSLYFETRIAGLRLPSEQGTWATLLPRLANAEGLSSDVYLGDELAQLAMPVLILWGEQDMAPVETGRAIAGTIPSCQFEYMPGIGHFPFLEAPERTSELIAGFIESTAG